MKFCNQGINDFKCYLEHKVPLELVVGDIHLVAEEEVELGDGG